MRSTGFIALALCCACTPIDADVPELSTAPPDDSSSDGADGSSSGAPDPSSSDESGPVPTDCPAPTAGPTMHPGDNVEDDQVWTADGSPHVVPYDFTIHARVTLEACARVQLGGSLTLTVGDGGELVAEGTAEQPIVIERLEEDRWATIRLLGGTASLAHAVLDGGGRTGNTLPELTGALLVRGREGATTPDGTLRVEHVQIRGSEAAGVRLEGVGAFTTDSDDLIVTDGASYPISAAATVVGTIPAGEYVGNADDQIVLTTANTETISSDATIRDHGVPYLVGSPGQVADLRVQAGPGGLATLTIEAGAILRFQPGSVLTVQHGSTDDPATGALVAIGTADAPIRLTSAASTPAAGDWLGVYFGGVLAPGNRMEHVAVEYAGGASSSGSNSCPYPGSTINDAAIRVFGVPPGAFVTNTAILASAAHGIDRGWRDDLVVEMQESNDFDVQGCAETWSRIDDGSCPDPVPCP